MGVWREGVEGKGGDVELTDMKGRRKGWDPVLCSVSK
jgi:hypothetical protein